MACGKYTASHGFFEQPLQRRVAGSEQIGGNAGPVKMHVDREGRCRCVVAEPTLFAHGLWQCEAQTAQLHRHREGMVPSLPELVEVFGEEAVLVIVFRPALREAGQHVVGQG